jgi:hypothetical protein
MSIYDTHKPESSSGPYLKLEDGQTVTVRIVSEPVIYQAESQDGKLSTRYGWIVWNQDEQKAQVLQQSATFFRNLAVLAKNKSWGDPTNNYDIDITREGTGLDTRYSITPSPNRQDLIGEAAIAINELDIIDMLSKSQFNQNVMWLSEFDHPQQPQRIEGTRPAPRPAAEVDDNTPPQNTDTVIEDIGDEPINLDDIPF